MADTARVGDTIGDRYRLEAALGHGGMAVVYRARHLGTDEACALKLIHPHLVERADVLEMFLKEAKVGARVGKHANIAHAFDTGLDARLRVPFLAMELLEGESLEQVLRVRGPLPRALLATVAEQLGDALEQAHEAGVVHRDLKPSNLFLTHDRRGRPVIKVLDFGIAKVLQDELHRTATQVGTPAYAAPEQLGATWRTLAAKQGVHIATTIGPATDVWALGLVVYDLLTGAAPGEYWGVETLAELPARVVLMEHELASVRAGARAGLLPPGFDAWFQRCTDRDATRRWPSAGDAIRALLPLLDAPSTTRAPAPGPVVAGGAYTSIGAATFAPAARPEAPEPSAAPAVATTGLPVETFLAAPPATATPRVVAVAAPRRTRALAIAAVIAVVGLVVGATLFVRARPAGTKAATGAPDPVTTPWKDDEAAVPIRRDDPSWGSRFAPATLVVFGDYERPESKRLDATLAKLRADYGPDKLRIVWKDLPRPQRPRARAAALAARAVRALKGDDAFWAFHDRLFANPKALGDADLEQRAAEVGLRPGELAAAMARPEVAKQVDEDVALAVRLHVTSAPTFFVSGAPGLGDQSADAVRTVLDAVTAVAPEVRGSAPPERWYGALVAHLRSRVAPETYAELERSGPPVFEGACKATAGKGGACVIYALELAMRQQQAEAARVVGSACEAGVVVACHMLAEAYLGGLGVARDVARAAELLEKNCAAGFAASCTSVGGIFWKGDGVPKDGARALAAFRKGCDGGLALDCAGAGSLFETGTGVPKDDVQAATMYDRACAGGLPDGCTALAMMVDQGRGVARDPARAAALVSDACADALYRACATLGAWALEGHNVKQDRDAGLTALRAGCDKGSANGSADACKKLDELHEPR